MPIQTLRDDRPGLWTVDLRSMPGEAALATLSRTEHDRAARFHQPVHRRRYLAAHVGTRTLIEIWCGIAPAAQRFTRDALGKPRLVGPGGLQFSLSYAGDIALIGLQLDRAIGVDIEREHRLPDAHELASLHFDLGERAHLSRLTKIARGSEGFLRGWTRKEACLKAIGTGLQLDPSTMSTGLEDARRAVAFGVTGCLHVETIALGDGLIGAWAQIDHACAQTGTAP